MSYTQVVVKRANKPTTKRALKPTTKRRYASTIQCSTKFQTACQNTGATGTMTTHRNVSTRCCAPVTCCLFHQKG